MPFIIILHLKLETLTSPYRHRLFVYLDFDGRTFSKNLSQRTCPLPRLFQRSKIESLTSRSYHFLKQKLCRRPVASKVEIEVEGRRSSFCPPLPTTLFSLCDKEATSSPWKTRLLPAKTNKNLS